MLSDMQVVGEVKQAAFRVFALLSFDAADSCDDCTDEQSTQVMTAPCRAR